MVAPTVRASTTKRARKNEVFDKMTTVRGVERDAPGQLMRAIADTMQSGKEGREGLERLKEKLQAQDKADRPSHKASFLTK